MSQHFLIWAYTGGFFLTSALPLDGLIVTSHLSVSHDGFSQMTPHHMMVVLVLTYWILF